MSGRDFFAVDSHRRSSPSSVVAVVGRRRRPSFPFFVQGRDLWKKSDFRCFSKKLTIFLKSKIFSKMSGRDFIAVDGRRRSSPSSVVAVVRHFHFFVQGRDLWKKSDFRCFSKKLTIFLKSKIFSKMSGRDFIAVDGRRRSSPSSVVAVVRHFHFFVQGRDLWKKSDFRCFSKKLTIFLKSKIFSKMSGRDFFAVVIVGRRRRRSSPSSVVAVVRHFPFSSKGGTFEKNQIFAVFQKNSQFFWNPRFLAKWVDEILSPSTVVVGRRRRRSSPSSVISTFSSKGGTFEKNQIFAVFQKNSQFFWNPRFLAKWVDEILSPSTVVVGRRRRRSSPSSVISTFSSKGGTFEKNQIFAVFQKNSQFFWNPRFLAKWVDEILSPSTVVVGRRRRRSSPSSVISTFSSKGGTFEKNQIFAVFQKNSQFFWNPRFLAKWVDEILSPSTVVVGRRRRRSSPSSVISTFSSKGGTFEKNQIFAVFQKNSQFFWNPRFLAKWVDEIFSPSTVIVGRRRRSSPSSVVRRRPSFPFFVQGRDLWKKSDFRCFSKKLTIFLKSKIFSKMSGRDFIAVDGRRRSSPSSVVAVVRHFHFFVQGRDLWKKSDFRCFSKTRNFSEIQDF